MLPKAKKSQTKPKGVSYETRIQNKFSLNFNRRGGNVLRGRHRERSGFPAGKKPESIPL
jgi:hypothetical protein